MLFQVKSEKLFFVTEVLGRMDNIQPVVSLASLFQSNVDFVFFLLAKHSSSKLGSALASFVGSAMKVRHSDT